MPCVSISLDALILTIVGADKNGTSPLLEALKGGHDHTAEVLYGKGGRLLLQDAGPYLCSTVMTGDIELLKRLLAYGADPNSTDYDLRTALHVAACEGLHLIVSVLLGAGAAVHAKDRSVLRYTISILSCCVT